MEIAMAQTVGARRDSLEMTSPHDLGVGFDDIFKMQVVKGDATLFWHDNWLGGGELARRYPSLFKKDKRKSCFVADRVSNATVKWDWLKKPSNQQEKEDAEEIEREVGNCTFTGEDDRWLSRLSADGKFYVGDLRKKIDLMLTDEMENPVVWTNIVPLKVTCFVWRAAVGRIPTKTELAKRGNLVNDVTCQLCAAEEEGCSHLFTDCPMVKAALVWVCNWCNLDRSHFSSVEDLIAYAAKWGRCPKKRQIILAIIYGFLWSTWKVRNDLIFKKVRATVESITDSVCTLVFGWVKYRGNYSNCNWASWICSPSSIL